MKKEYEVAIEIFNACAGSSRPQISFDEVELDNPDDYVREKHGDAFSDVKKKIGDNGEIQYILVSESVTYKYTFTEF